MIKAKSKKAAPDICPKISNKISIRGALSVVEAMRQNILEVFSLPNNYDKLPLVAIEAISSPLAGFSPVKVPSKRHTWISLSVAFIPTKSPKVFNNRPVNKLVFFFIASTSGTASITSSKKMIKKTKSSEKWEQLLISAIVTLNHFVVPNEILDEISVVSSSTSSKMGQDQLLAVLPNVVSSDRSSPILEAKQSPLVGSSVLKNWADQIKTELSFSLVVFTLVSGATFKIKLAHVKAVFQSVHGFLGAKSVSKDNVKLFCVEFASQTSLDAVFLVKLTSSVCLATLKIAKSLVVSKSGSPSTAVALCDVLLGVSAADIKTALSVFGSVTRIVLKPASVWQYMVVYFEKLNSAVSALNYWSVLVGKDSVRILLLVNQNKTILSCDRFKAKLVNLSLGCTAFEISDMISQVGGQSCFIPQSLDSGYCFYFTLVMFGSQADLNLAVTKTGHLAVDCKVALSSFSKVPKVFKLCFVGFLSYVKVFAPSVMSEFPPLVTSASSVQIGLFGKANSDLAALVKSIVEPVGSLVVLVEKDLLSIKYAFNNFANLIVGVSKDIACLRFEVDFGGMDYDNIQAAKPFLLSENTVEHVIALWQMSGAEIKSSVKSTRLFLSEFIFDSRNLNGIIKKICGLGLFSPSIISV
ncbi:hypothetical protein G9A89_018501 [Geosiphon pyriformis]|nr:hypothetical protein G9A89_018501 [Geosiphon pyriformis]